jgi:predicted transposase YbfD/YdcC
VVQRSGLDCPVSSPPRIVVPLVSHIRSCWMSFMATTPNPVSLAHHFATLDDPRIERSRRHELIDIIGIALRAVISGAESWPAIERYGHAKRDWLEKHFRLAGGIPSHDTFRRVFCLLEPGAFQRSFADWVAALADGGVGTRRAIPIDGKTARRSGRRGAGLAPLHLVSAWAGANHVTLGQIAVDEKSNEITAIPKLLEVLDLNGALVTIDAMGCQKEIAAQIVDGHGDYLLVVKENHPHLYEDIDTGFTEALETDYEGLESSVFRAEVESDRGRQTTRECHVIAHPKGLRGAGLWKGLKAICMVLTHRRVEGVESVECRYYIGSFVGPASEYLSAIRGHWGIENSLHWVLDVVFREDESRHHAGNSGENLALLRRLAISLLKQEESSKDSLKTKRLRCGWDNEYLAKVLAANKLEDA